MKKRKFDLLYEQVINSLSNIKDCVYFKWNIKLYKYLTQKQLIELANKCFQLTKDKLLDAYKTKTKISFDYFNPEFKIFNQYKDAIIENIYEQNGKWFIRFKNKRKDQIISMLNNSNIQTKQIENHPWLKIYNSAILIDNIIIQDVPILLNNIVKEYETEIKKYNFNEYKHIFENVSTDIKYIFDHDFTLGQYYPVGSTGTNTIQQQLFKFLLFTKESNLKVIKRCGLKELKDKELLQKFNLNPESKEVKYAIKTLENPEAAYYGSSSTLFLTVIINIAEGKKLDITRLSCFDYNYYTSYKKGYGTEGEF